MNRVFDNGLRDWGSIPSRVIPKTQKTVLDASLLGTQLYKVGIKGKVEQSRERSSTPPTPWFSSYLKKESSGHPRLRIMICLKTISITYEYLKIYKSVQIISFKNSYFISFCPVSWGCRIHRLHLCRGVIPPLTSVLDMTLNNLMVRFQQCWSFGECGVPLHCHHSQVHSGLEW